MEKVEIDKALAEKVMGWKWDSLTGWSYIGADGRKMWSANVDWSPSTSRDDLAEVLAKLTDEQWEKVQWALVKDLAPQLCTLKFWLTATTAQVALAAWRAVCQ